MQSATSLLLTAVLLACPHVCRLRGHVASYDAGKASSAPHCPLCCPSAGEKPHSPASPAEPGAPEPTDCICKGAICAAADMTPAIDVQQPTGWLDNVNMTAAAIGASGHEAILGELAGASPPVSGRVMRLLMASLRF